MGSNDEVNHPQHYQLFPDMEAFDVIKRTLSPEELRGYLKGNILKYRLRAGKKGDAAKCVAKADWYSRQLFDASPKVDDADVLKLFCVAPPSPKVDDALAGIITPKWAQWLAQDADGTWWAYEHAPKPGRYRFQVDTGEADIISTTSCNPNWRDTLRRLTQ